MFITRNRKKPNKLLNCTEMINAFKLDGCPICRRIDATAHKYIENILYESVTGFQVT